MRDSEKELQETFTWARSVDFSDYNGVLGYYQVQACLEYSRGKSLLDMPCGDGTLTALFANHFQRIVGLDASSTHLDEAKKRLPQVEFYHDLIENYQTNERFDTITMLNVLEHVEEPIQILQKAASLLSDDGVLLVHVPNDLERGVVNGVVIAFNRNLSERHRVFLELVEKDIPFVNIIDPTVDMRTGVQIGTGNVVLGNVYIGACTKIRDNNFISANVVLEHGNSMGSSCAFGPGVFTSGNVKIGDLVRFGTGIFIEPGLTIGSECVVGSGQTIVTSIKDNTVLTSRAKS